MSHTLNGHALDTLCDIFKGDNTAVHLNMNRLRVREVDTLCDIFKGDNTVVQDRG